MLSLFAAAKDSPTPEMKPLMTMRGKLLFSDDFSSGPVARNWKAGKGQWDIVDGALKGVELPADKHAANVRHAMDYHNGIFQFSFRLDGAKMTAFMFNNKDGHVGRVTITPAGFTVRRDKPNAKSQEQAAVLATVNMPFKAGQWYTMLVEVEGGRILARIDDSHFGFGEHKGIDVDKKDFGMPVGGEASFDNIRVWEALPNPSWDKKQLDHLSKR
jgi:3-keto-disaccharide hydrolase